MPTTRKSRLAACVFACLAVSIPVLGVASGSVIAYCYQPVDGSGLHQIYFINADGTGNRKAIESDIGLNHQAWSPDGGSLAAVGYVDEDTWSIYTFRAGGTGLVRLTATAGVWDSEPAWSPDGTLISFTRTYPDREYREELWVMNADGSEQRWLGRTGAAAQWSPDGTQLVYSDEAGVNRDLFVCNADGTGELPLTDTTAYEMFPSWSPDGRSIAYARSENGAYNYWEIYVMDLDSGAETRLTTNHCYDGYPRWSPEGDLLSFESDASGYERWEVYVMRPDGSDQVRVTTSPRGITAINPVWKP